MAKDDDIKCYIAKKKWITLKNNFFKYKPKYINQYFLYFHNELNKFQF